METNGRALIEALRTVAGDKHVVLEEGTQSAWLYELLRLHVEEVVVAGVTQSRGQKSDAKDAWTLAKKLRTGTLDKVVFRNPDPGSFETFALLQAPSPGLCHEPPYCPGDWTVKTLGPGIRDSEDTVRATGQ